MTTQEIQRQLLHEEQTAIRVAMVRRVERMERKRIEKYRTLERRTARFTKFVLQGRL